MHGCLSLWVFDHIKKPANSLFLLRSIILGHESFKYQSIPIIAIQISWSYNLGNTQNYSGYSCKSDILGLEDLACEEDPLEVPEQGSLYLNSQTYVMKPHVIKLWLWHLDSSIKSWSCVIFCYSIADAAALKISRSKDSAANRALLLSLSGAWSAYVTYARNMQITGGRLEYI